MNNTDVLIQSVLFVCSYNAVRSPMAAEMLRWRSGGKLYVRSCGVQEGGETDVFANEVMKELGLDISGHVPVLFKDLDDGAFDLIVAMSPDAMHHMKAETRTESVDIEYWPTYDATVERGSRDHRLSAYREVREQIDQKIKKRFHSLMTF